MVTLRLHVPKHKDYIQRATYKSVVTALNKHAMTISPITTQRKNKMLISLTQAIARQEGFYVHGSRAQRNNSPGNLNFGDFAMAYGALGPDDKGYAIFPSPEHGFGALEALLQTKRYRGKTIREALMIYCPPTGDPRGDNDTLRYIRNVAEWTGLTPDTVIDPYVTVPHTWVVKTV